MSLSIESLPAINASFNGLSTALLLLGWGFIRKGRKEAHRNCMIGAVISSLFFLAGYLTYHFTVHGVTRFTNPPWFRPIYLSILISHTLLAVAVPPLVIATVFQAVRQRFEAHKRIARWTWPIWLYVSCTGVLIWLLLYKVFPQRF